MSNSNKGTMGHAMSHILDTGLHSDLSFVVGPTRHQINAHKLILLSRSPVFETMFHERWQTLKDDNENRKIVEIPHTDVHSFKRLLKFIYTDILIEQGLSVDEGLELLKLSHMYQVQNLLSKCVNFLNRNISINNCSKIYMDTKLYEDTHLSQTSFKFIKSNIVEVVANGQLLLLDEDSFAKLLKSDELDIEETKLFKGLVSWITNKEENGSLRGDVKTSLLMLIRYPLMTVQDFTTEVVPTKMLSDQFSIFRYLNGEMWKEGLLAISDVPRKFQNKVQESSSVSLSKLGFIKCFGYDESGFGYDQKRDGTSYRTLSCTHRTVGSDTIYEIMDAPLLHPQFRFKCNKGIEIHGLMFYGIKKFSFLYPGGYIFRVDYNIKKVSPAYIPPHHHAQAQFFEPQPAVPHHSSAIQNKSLHSDSLDSTIGIEETKVGHVKEAHFPVQFETPLKIVADQWYWINAGRLMARNNLPQRIIEYERIQGTYVYSQIIETAYGCSNVNKEEVIVKYHSDIEFHIGHHEQCKQDKYSHFNTTFHGFSNTLHPTGVVHSIIFKP